MSLGNLDALANIAKVAARKKGKEVLTVPLENVVSKAQIRKQFKNIKELADTMLTEGQQSPVIVYPKNADGKYVIQKGERRWRALYEADIGVIDIIVNEKAQSKIDETAGELIENIQREDLTALEIAHALQTFINDGWKQKDIARRIGKHAIFISKHLSLLKLPDCVRVLYDNEICNDVETLNNLRVLFELNERRCISVCESAGEGGITRQQSRDLIDDAKRIEEERVKSKNQPTANASIDAEQPPSSDASTNLPDVLDENDDQNGALEGPESTLLGHPDSDESGHVSIAGEAQEQGYQDALPPLPKEKDWDFTEPKNVILTVNYAMDTEVKRGILLLDRICTNKQKVWIKVFEKNKEKIIQVMACDVELVRMEV